MTIVYIVCIIIMRGTCKLLELVPNPLITKNMFKSVNFAISQSVYFLSMKKPFLENKK